MTYPGVPITGGHTVNDEDTNSSKNTNWSHVERHPSTVSPSILEGVRDDHQHAWERLVYLYGPMVYRQCRRQGLQAADAKDLVQEVFLKVRSGLPKFDREREGGSFTRWIKVITTNSVKEYCRHRGKHPLAIGGSGIQGVAESLTASDPDEEPDCGAGDAEVARRALDLVRTDFSEKTVEVFIDYAINGLPVRTIAERYEMKPAAIRQAKARILKRLRKELEGLIDFANGDQFDDGGSRESSPDSAG